MLLLHTKKALQPQPRPCLAWNNALGYIRAKTKQNFFLSNGMQQLQQNKATEYNRTITFFIQQAK